MANAARCVALLLLVSPLSAMTGQPRMSSPALDVSVGFGRGYGGPDVPDRGILSGAVLLATPARVLRHGALIIAAHASANLLWSTTYCAADFGTCRDYPSHASLGVLGGWAQRDDQGSGVRVFAGPGYFTTSDSRNGIGLLARVDGAERLTARLSFVFWAQAHAPPGRRGERLTVGLAGVGMRVHRQRTGRP